MHRWHGPTDDGKNPSRIVTRLPRGQATDIGLATINAANGGTFQAATGSLHPDLTTSRSKFQSLVSVVKRSLPAKWSDCRSDNPTLIGSTRYGGVNSPRTPEMISDATIFGLLFFSISGTGKHTVPPYTPPCKYADPTAGTSGRFNRSMSNAR